MATNSLTSRFAALNTDKKKDQENEKPQTTTVGKSSGGINFLEESQKQAEATRLANQLKQGTSSALASNEKKSPSTQNKIEITAPTSLALNQASVPSGNNSQLNATTFSREPFEPMTYNQVSPIITQQPESYTKTISQKQDPTASEVTPDASIFSREPFETRVYSYPTDKEKISQYIPKDQVNEIENEQVKEDASFDRIEEPRDRKSALEMIGNALDERGKNYFENGGMATHGNFMAIPEGQEIPFDDGEGGMIDSVIKLPDGSFQFNRSDGSTVVQGAIKKASYEDLLDTTIGFIYEEAENPMMFPSKEELDEYLPIYEELYKSKDPNYKYDPSTSLLGPENLMRIWNETLEEFDAKHDVFDFDKYRESGELPSPSDIKDLYGTGFMELFLSKVVDQLNDEQWDDGTISTGNLVSEYITKEQYLEQRKAGIPGRPIEEIEAVPDGYLFEKSQECLNYGYVPYLPDEFAQLKYMAEIYLHGGEKAQAEMNNLREVVTDAGIDLGDGNGMRYDYTELVDGMANFYEVNMDDMDHFTDMRADHTGEKLYVPKLYHIKTKDGSDDLLVPGGVYNVYSIQDGRVLIDFPLGQTYIFDNYDDYLNRFFDVEENQAENITEWVESEDPNLLMDLDENYQNIAAFKYGLDYPDENGNIISFLDAQKILSDIGTYENFDYDFGPLAIAKPSEGLKPPGEWFLDPIQYPEQFAPAMTDLFNSSSLLMLDGGSGKKFGLGFGDYVGLGGALSALSNVAPFAVNPDGTRMPNKQENGIDDETAQALIDSGLMTEHEIELWNNYTDEQRFAATMSAGLMGKLEQSSEFIDDKTFMPVAKKIQNKLFANPTYLKAYIKLLSDWGIKITGESAEEILSNYAEEWGEYGKDFMYTDPIVDPETGETIKDANGNEIRGITPSFMTRFMNSTSGWLDSGVAAGMLAGVMNAPSTVSKTTQLARIQKLQRIMENGDMNAARSLAREFGLPLDIPSLEYARDHMSD